MLASNIAIVIGPTPPGTGVILPATAAAESKSTSPTSPSSVRFMPTSITVAPGLIQSPLTISGRPTAAIKTSARRQTAARSRVREWQTVTVASALTRRLAIGRPTRIERPITTASAPSSSTPDRSRISTTPAGVQGISPATGSRRVELEGLPYADPPLCEQARVDGRQSVDVLARRDLRQHDGLIDVVGKRHLDEDAVDLGVAIELGDERDELGLGDVGRELVVDRADPGLLAGLALVADVDVGGRVVADEDRRQAGRPLAGRDPRFDDVLDPPAERGGDRLAVENLGAHVTRRVWIGA